MYYTDSYWAALLTADTERRRAYEKAVAKAQSHDSRAREVNDADKAFAKAVRNASQEADREIAMAVRVRAAEAAAIEMASEPERLARHRDEEEMKRKLAKAQSDKLEPVMRQKI